MTNRRRKLIGAGTDRRGEYDALGDRVSRLVTRRAVVYGFGEVRFVAGPEGVSVAWPRDARIESEEDLAGVHEALSRAVLQWKQMAAAEAQNGKTPTAFDEPEIIEHLLLLFDPGHAEPVPVVAPLAVRGMLRSGSGDDFPDERQAPAGDADRHDNAGE